MSSSVADSSAVRDNRPQGERSGCLYLVCSRRKPLQFRQHIPKRYWWPSCFAFLQPQKKTLATVAVCRAKLLGVMTGATVSRRGKVLLKQQTRKRWPRTHRHIDARTHIWDAFYRRRQSLISQWREDLSGL